MNTTFYSEEYIISNEAWTWITGFQAGKQFDYTNYYEVSNYGRIRSVNKIIKYKQVKPYFRKGRILKARVDVAKTRQLKGDIGYLSVSLSKNGIVKSFAIHKLVAEGFLGRCPNQYEIDHIDDNKHNNHIDNLQYLSTKEHHQKDFLGEKNGFCKFSDIHIQNAIVEYNNTNQTQRQICKKYNISTGHFCGIINNKRRQKVE